MASDRDPPGDTRVEAPGDLAGRRASRGAADARTRLAAELARLAAGASPDEPPVDPTRFGALFQASMGAAERHALGAHYTSEEDIARVVEPTLLRPLRARIAAARTREALLAVRAELPRLRVLDPACGSGNFLYVAYRELVRVELALLDRLRREFPGEPADARVDVTNFLGIDIDADAVALARMTLLCARQRAHVEVRAAGFAAPGPLAECEHIVCADALFVDWPPADVVIGNPPFQAKNRMQAELGAEYVQRLRRRYPEVPGRADYCVYWFRRAHDHLPPGGRAGLVGTNTIRENDSRRGGLAHIVAHGGVITDAVATQVWSGAAAVHVSIVNWVKGAAPGPAVLRWQVGDRADGAWTEVELARIGPALAASVDVTSARALRANRESGACYQGQTHGHAGFLLAPEEARARVQSSPRDAEVLFPFLIADDLLGRPDGGPSRYVIDFGDRDLDAARTFVAPFARVQARVLPERQRAAAREAARNSLVAPDAARVNRHHAVFLSRWWRLSWGRPELLARLAQVPRYVACAQVGKRPIFEFVASTVRPNAAIIVFPLADDYSFGVLQSQIHWRWFTARCSTLKGDYRYTSRTVFDSLPWPQAPTLGHVEAVARASVELRALRRSLIAKHGIARRDLYRRLAGPGRSPLAEAHAALDTAVLAAYGMKATDDVLALLLDLNLALAAREEAGEAVRGPGLPDCVEDPAAYVTRDAIAAPA